jgi:DNA-binding NtrC family response regulator
MSLLQIKPVPLRERLEDIPQLIQMFIDQYAAQNQKDVIGADEECVKALQANPWPGNVRQLRNVIERAVIICEGRTICTNDLPDPFRVADTTAASYIKMPLGSSLEAVEKEMILRTIEFTRGNRTRAAATLGVSIKTLYNKLGQYGLEPRREFNSRLGSHAR